MPKVETSNEAEPHARDGDAGREQFSRLTIKVEPDAKGYPVFVVRDDRGFKIRGVRNLQINSEIGDVTTVTMQFVLERKREEFLEDYIQKNYPE